MTVTHVATQVSPMSRLITVAEDRGFEPLRAINPTRFPTLGPGVVGRSQSSAERAFEARGRLRTGVNADK